MARQPVTLLFESLLEGVDGRPKLLLAGTANKLARFSVDGTWTLLHRHSFCSSGDLLVPRFLVAQLAGLCLVAHTKGGFWDLTFDAKPTEVDGEYSYLTPNDSLIALGIESAQVVAQSKGFFFIADVVENGTINNGLVYWSGFETTSFITGGDSEAGYVSLGGDKVTAVEELGEILVFYTHRSIWFANYVGGASAWNFKRVYVGPDVPAYPRSVVNLGDMHIYLTANSVRVLFRGEREPRDMHWMTQAVGCIFNGIRPGLLDGMPAGSVDYPRKIQQGCMHVVGWYNSIDKMVGWSWADSNSELQNWSLMLSIPFKTACLMDHGVTSATMTTQPLPGSLESLRAFLARTMGCPAKPDLNEHDPFPAGSPTLGDEPDHLYNATEDPALPPSDDSYCSIIEASDQPCLSDCGPCSGPMRMILASAEDFCIKEFRWDFDRREQIETIEDPAEWNNVPVVGQEFSAQGPNPVAAATYGFNSYYTIFQSDLFISGDGKNLGIQSVSMDMVPMEVGSDYTESLVPSLEMPWPVTGQGASADSPKCASWNLSDTDPFSCGVVEDVPDYVRGAEAPLVNIEVEGRYVAYRLYVGGAANIGPVAFVGLTMRGESVGGC